MNVSFSKSSLPGSGSIAVISYEDHPKPAAFEGLDKATGGALTRAAKAADFSGKAGQVVEILAPANVDYNRVLLIGLGKPDALKPLGAESAGGRAAARLFVSGETSLAFALDGLPSGDLGDAELAARVAYGARLRCYSFDKYRTKVEKKDKPSLNRIVVDTSAADAAQTLYGDLARIADGVFLTRDLVAEPPNVLYPVEFAARARELESLGLKVEILDEAQMTKLGMGALLGVGQGSTRESRIAVMRWDGGAKDERPICFVGKGVCFDAGGLSLKPPAGMEDMKWDMGGAGAVTGAMAAIAGRKAKANVIGVIGLVENMPDGNAQRPSDVVTTMSGQTVEVLNTDAEGRLVLADAMWYAQEKYKPHTLIDLATLTGAIIVSLAHEYAGMFTKDDALAEGLIAAGKRTGEELWRMPLGEAYDDMLKSDIADMKNIGGKGGGSCTAAAFLGKFIKDGVSWAHLDIAGMAWTDKEKPTTPKGAVGFAVKLLDDYVRTTCEG